MRESELPGRSTVHGTNGICASSHPLATLTAIDMLRRGGHAVDAAIAASAVLCVVEPMSTGLGGDCFVLLAPHGGPEIVALNGSGRAPWALSAEDLRAQGLSRIPYDSVHAVTIPGAVAAWCRLMEDYGRLGLEEVLRPAIDIAEQGFALSPLIAEEWARLASHIGRSESGRRHFLTASGRAPRTGEVFRCPALAETLRRIARQGWSGFYEGEVAEDMLNALKALGGRHEGADFAATKAESVTPLTTRYHGVDVYELPPNGQGLTALVMFNILKRFDLGAHDPLGAERLHLEMEAQRLAFQMRDRYICDPAFAACPIDRVLSEDFAAARAAEIDPRRAGLPPASLETDLERDTIYLTVVDGECNTVSFINSLYMGFGSGIVAPRTAIAFQNRGMGFVLDPGHPNELAGGKRPKHTIIPALACHHDGPYAGRVAWSFGVMGGDYQPVGHVHVLTHMVVDGFDEQEALDAPRVFYQADHIACERGVAAPVREALRAMGHVVKPSSIPLGGGQVVRIDWQKGSFCAGSDPRKDGLALAF